MSDIIDLRATSFGAFHKVDFFDLRGIERKNDLYANAERNLADGNGERGALAAFFGDNHAFKDLETLFAAFFDLAGDANDIAGSDRREVSAPLGEVECNEFLIHIGTIKPRKKNHPKEGSYPY